jgi:hypothetical protein
MTKDEALRLALKALRFARDDGYENEVSQEAITTIKAALEAKDEPVSSYGYCPVCGAKGAIRERHPDGNTICVNRHTYKSRDALLTPPQRTWVGLTDEEIKSQWSVFWEADCHPWAIDFARAIESKLKEKNT